jgi:HD-GYP domain-containing protein (c-di-GMP phosphodiesterase class II)
MRPSAATEESGFLPIHLCVMQPGTIAPVDLYLRVGSSTAFTLYRNASTPLNEEIRQRLLDRNVTALYVRREDEKAYLDYVEQNLVRIVADDLLPPDEACALVSQCAERVMEEVFEDPRSGQTLKRVAATVEPMVMTIVRNPKAISHMTALASHHYETYTHSVQVSVFLLGSASFVLGMADLAMLQRIGLGGMLHDIGKTEVPKEILLKPGPLTDEEFDLVKLHPVAGLDILEEHARVPATAAAIIRSHHERVDGQGYPDGLTGEHMRPIVKLSKICDVYDALTTDRPYATARSPFDALAVMKKMEGQFDTEMLDAFIRFLGPDGPLA